MSGLRDPGTARTIYAVVAGLSLVTLVVLFGLPTITRGLLLVTLGALWLIVGIAIVVLAFRNKRARSQPVSGDAE